MNEVMLKMLLKAAAKSLPHIVAKLSTKEYLVRDLTMAELVNVFTSNPNSPQCITTTSLLSGEQIMVSCQQFLSQNKFKMSSDTTKDGWQVILAEKEPPLFGFSFDSKPHTLLISATSIDSQTCRLIVGCRFTETGKIDLFNTYKKQSLKQIEKVAQALRAQTALVDIVNVD